MFKLLRTKLTVVYATLFGVVMLVMAGAVYAAVSTNAVESVRDEMTATGTVFDRVWALRSGRLRDGSELLSRDFGFRSAVATADDATVRSALDNLRGRLALDGAMLMNTDGSIVAAGGLEPDEAALDSLWTALDGGGQTSGVLTIRGQPYQIVASPIMAPVLTGWVIFAVKLDAGEMRELESLAAVPLKAQIVTRDATGSWHGEPRLAAFLKGTLGAQKRGVGELTVAGQRDLALAKPLPSLDAKNPSALVLRYPISTALEPFHAMLAALVLLGLAGLGLLIVGSLVLARNVTRPITALDDAVHRLQRGEDANVAVAGNDEIARLADNFNVMAADIRKREAEITHLALHDADTTLPNRLSLERWLEGHTDDLGDMRPYVAAVSVDRFEHVRSAIGHRLAADLLRQLGNRLTTGRKGMVTILSPGVLGLGFTAPSDDGAYRVADQVLSLLEYPVTIEGAAVDVLLTIGLASGWIGAGVLASPIERAVVSVEQARAQRRKVADFDQAAYGDPASALSLMSEMLAALEAGQMSLHHQPKYDLRAGAVNAVEALSRWNHPERGFIRPDVFIEMAEETGYIRPLTEWVLDQAIADQATMRAAGRDLLVSVNISGRLLGDSEFADIAIAKVQACDARLCFEITETAVMDNPELALDLIDRFVAVGIKISIDDYGSGLSSLSYLKRIRADELKIDKSLLDGLEDGARDALLLKSTIDLAHGLGMKVVAEGVETATAMAVLQSMGCDVIQGYFIAKALPLTGLIAFLGERDADQSQRRAG